MITKESDNEVCVCFGATVGSVIKYKHTGRVVIDVSSPLIHVSVDHAIRIRDEINELIEKAKELESQNKPGE